MNLQSIDRLQHLLERVRVNAKRPRTHTQGLGAHLAYAAAPSDQASKAPVAPQVPEAAQPGARAPQAAKPEAQAKPEVFVEPSLSPLSIPADELEEIEISVSPEPPAAESGRKVRAPEISAVEIVTEDLSIEDVSVEELGVEEIPIEIGSELTLEKPELESEPAAARVPAAATASVVPQTYTAPPSLDDLTFSEPPPPRSASPEARESEIEPPPASLAQLVSEESEPPGSIDAALLAATEAQAGTGGSEVPIVTPPPESGPQVAVPPMGAPGLPRATAPTMEQLGEVVELETPSVIPIELADRKATEIRATEKATRGTKDSSREPVRPHAAEKTPASEQFEFAPRASQPSAKLEAREPMQTLVGGFTEEQGTGKEARGPEPLHPQVRVSTQGAPFAAEESPTAASSPAATLTPETLLRPKRVGEDRVLDVVAAAHAFRPHSFIELLDASLNLLK
ncbi:MAG TPA: hypothetical protein VKP30_16005 [Polyangiaceae bacterium]|nr:hypothetical protein [Polyangiaceae bacterium]